MLAANISQFRKNMKFYFDSVADNHDTLVLSGNGKTVVMITLDEYNSLDETAYLLSTEANKKMMYRALEQSKEGKLVSKTIEELEEMVSKRPTLPQ